MEKSILKKCIAFELLLTMIFALAACDVEQDFSGKTLDEYKADAKQIIENYAEERKDSFCKDNWAIVCDIVETGKQAVENATTEQQVDTAVGTAKTAINAIDEIEEEENVEMKTQAKQSYLDIFLKAEHPEATINDVSFRPFLGIYNDNLVAVFYGGQYHGDFPDVEEEVEIADLIFAWSRGYPILVFSDTDMYELVQAYSQGLLTKENLISIHNIYYNDGSFYALQEAFDMGLLMMEDLQNIANYQNNHSIPTCNLNNATRNSIKESWAAELRSQGYTDATAEYVAIIKYYGTYNECFAIMLENAYFDHITDGRIEVIAGIVFNYNNGNSIMVWKAQ